MSRIGIYAGTFDPIHKGHIAFAEVTLRQANLDEVIFLPERKPRHKHGATSYDHRVTMIEDAIRGLPGLRVSESTSLQFTVDKTLPELKHSFPDATFVFLLGSDVFEFIPSWKDSKLLLETSELAIATRNGLTDQDILAKIQKWLVFPRVFTVVSSDTYDSVSSSKIRADLAESNESFELQDVTTNYIQKNRLYQK
jgi:nicotinate-nucleotide adenylyltransferase